MSPGDLVLGAFAGPGGWCTGLRMAGYEGPSVGVEIDRFACLTAAAAGHMRIRADVATFPLAHLAGRVVGVVQSPPCPTWSTAGDGAGKLDMANVYRLIADFANNRTPGDYVWVDERSRLTAEPMRWAVALRPRWIALEQVPPVLPLWRHLAALLRERGYYAWAGVLSAEEHGVPQTRKRAILMASLDGPIGPPTPTHQAYQSGRDAQSEPDLFGDLLPPPVSMAQALGWGSGEGVAYKRTRGAGMTERHGERPTAPADGPAPTITSKSRSDVWQLRNGTQDNACTRALDEPAGTMFFGKRGNAVDWVMRNGAQENATDRTPDEPAGTIFSSRSGNLRWTIATGNNSRQAGGATIPFERDTDAPSPTLTGNVSRWQARPATTVCGDPRIAPPGHRDHEGGEPKFGEGTVRVTVQEAGILQSFPGDYPWRGSKTAQYGQVGDAVPPLLAAAILRPLLASSDTARSAA